MKKVRERRSVDICLDRMSTYQVDIMKHYLDCNFEKLAQIISYHYNITEKNNSEESRMLNDINIYEILFECYTYYNAFDVMCEVEIINFL